MRTGPSTGTRGALYEWVAKQEAAGCDRYILSLDQLLSGGLVSSRAMTGENPVTLSSGETLVEAELLTAVIDLLAADENNRIWLLDTVMRLAATSRLRRVRPQRVQCPADLRAWHPVPTWRARV